jgi:hypothetical protein
MIRKRDIATSVHQPHPRFADEDAHSKNGTAAAPELAVLERVVM